MHDRDGSPSRRRSDQAIPDRYDSPFNPFDDLAASYDRMRGIPPSALERIADEVVQRTGATPATRFFEPGVGTGRIAAPFLRRGYHYIGLDLSAAMLRVLRNRPGGDRCPVVRSDVRALPFADASFDIVLTTHLLYLVDNWRGALREIRRVLRPGGNYVHCFEQATSTPVAHAVAEKWQDSVSEFAARASWATATTDTEVLTVLQSSGAVVESSAVARWSRRRTLEQFLSGYAARMRPLYPDIPDYLFADLVADFLGWARHTYPHGATVGQDVRFKIHLVRWKLADA